MQIDAPNRDFPRRCEKQGGMAQSAEHIVHIMGRGAERRQWRMKRRRKRSEQQVQTPLQGGCTPIANLTERAKRSETVGSSPTVTTTRKPL